MTRLWVVNASPLIVLGKLSQIDLIVKLADVLVIPEAVVHEIEKGEASDPAKIWLADDGREFVKIAPTNHVIQSWDLGLGESHVLSWALANTNYEAILDDFAARQCAQTLSIPVRGTLGILLLAKKTGLITKIEPLIDALLAAGFHIAPSVLKTIRNLAGE